MTLNQLFTGIANKIRSIKGTTDPIPAEDFEDEMDGMVVPTGTLSITQNGTVDVKNYAEANVNIQGNNDYNVKMNSRLANTTITKNITEFSEIDGTNLTTFASLFENFSVLTKVSFSNTTNITSTRNIFMNCPALTTVSNLDTRNVTDMHQMFSGCSSLITAINLNTNNVRDVSFMYAGCRNLVDVYVMNTSNVTNFFYMFYNCTSLSNDSLNNIMEMCINATNYSGTKTLKQLGLSQTQANTCQTLSNWNSFTSAGWSTGY